MAIAVLSIVCDPAFITSIYAIVRAFQDFSKIREQECAASERRETPQGDYFFTECGNEFWHWPMVMGPYPSNALAGQAFTGARVLEPVINDEMALQRARAHVEAIAR